MTYFFKKKLLRFSLDDTLQYKLGSMAVASHVWNTFKEIYIRKRKVDIIAPFFKKLVFTEQIIFDLEKHLMIHLLLIFFLIPLCREIYSIVKSWIYH